ncbi:PREDICTED: uncharacterized protein LOC109479380 [Branchiostoma belcheri]|uniref:Uncharacterized protein LOC109479380 n=1 Tax=Branchiostoma belcheri TaxID=7741 RepID=A0A6P5A118_BRABE|nr:PREDICTED: uncharacterized protein LOC109479380 [Branchiostoma belcheri]
MAPVTRNKRRRAPVRKTTRKPRKPTKKPAELPSENAGLSLMSLSDEVIDHILSYLQGKALFNASQVCRKLRALVDAEGFWRRKLQTDFDIVVRHPACDTYKETYKYMYMVGYFMNDNDKWLYNHGTSTFELGWYALLRAPPGHTYIMTTKAKQVFNVEQRDLEKIYRGLVGSQVDLRPANNKVYKWSDIYDYLLDREEGKEGLQLYVLKRCGAVNTIQQQYKLARERCRAGEFKAFYDSLPSHERGMFTMTGQRDYYFRVGPAGSGPHLHHRLTIDFVDGQLHRGMETVRGYMYALFRLVNYLKDDMRIPEWDAEHEAMRLCNLHLYHAFVGDAQERVVSDSEFYARGVAFLERWMRLYHWRVHDDILRCLDILHRKDMIKEHPKFKAFMKEGREQDFKDLVSYFRNMTKLYKCLQPYSCLKKIFKQDSAESFSSFMESPGRFASEIKGYYSAGVSFGPVPWFSEPKQDSDFAPVRRTMDEFLQTGRPATLTKLLTLLCDKSDRILDRQKADTDSLRRNARRVVGEECRDRPKKHY